ncbi:MAG: sodium-dependent transporter [Hydrogenovibrio sp.]|uniref:sodium-dependent transporter n=1 Tax=Hydrogenovibrio TaxID=28884 RepID=UPI00035CF13D|nr:MULTISPECIES: sodium-dependent transporter [Hydrogenovibrio]MDR9497614.1 sodium-dependent transporter [Hydrogenovibrio sp.]
MAQSKNLHATWSSQTIFVLAAVGSAVGLGNLWKFPYITGENGGAAFVLVYLLCILAVGLPILIAEITLGRAGQASPPQAMANIVRKVGGSRLWVFLGINGVLGGLLILSFYSVIAGWGLAYFLQSLQGNFVGMDAQGAQNYFDQFVASPGGLVFWHSLIMVATVLIVIKGVRSGIERAINIMMPGLLVILLILFGYAMTMPAFSQSFDFLFQPDFSKLTANSILVALGHAFFTLSLGFGTMMVYGSYLPKSFSIIRATLWIVVADTVIALLAGLVIFSIVFDNGLTPGAGPGLLFQTLPVAFSQMQFGWLLGTLFFAMVVLAALSSAISMIEPGLSWLEQNWGIARAKGAWWLGGGVWFLGLGSALAFNLWQDVTLIGERDIFESMDFLTSNLMLPLGGLFTALFVGWVWSRQQRDQQTGMPPSWSGVYTLVIRWIAPILVAIVFVNNLIA